MPFSWGKQEVAIDWSLFRIDRLNTPLAYQSNIDSSKNDMKGSREGFSRFVLFANCNSEMSLHRYED